MTELPTARPRPRRIFLSHAYADTAEADRIQHLLSETGIEVRWLESMPGTDRTAAEAVEVAVAASDVIVVLLSPTYIDSA